MKLRPIETAPKDDTKILVCQIGRAYDPVAGAVEDEERIWWVSCGYYNERGDYWSDGIERLVRPTHWCPLTDFEWEKENDPS